MFEGSCCALVTPMDKSGEIDDNAFIELVYWHIQEGTQAIVVAGTTGEGSALSNDEFERITKLAVQAAGNRIPIIAGTGTNSTKTTIEKTKLAQSLGVDGCLIVTPYYNRPTQAGLKLHYEAVAKAADLPIFLYNVPSRTACDMQPETVAYLSQIPNIIGLKEATGNIQRLHAILDQCASGFILMSGDDPTAQSFIQNGGKGVISITANVAPQLMQKMCHAALSRDDEKARGLDLQLQPLHRMLIAEPNPIPVKWALSYIEKIESSIRSPLTTLSSELHEKMKQALQVAGIYSPHTSF